MAPELGFKNYFRFATMVCIDLAVACANPEGPAVWNRIVPLPEDPYGMEVEHEILDAHLNPLLGYIEVPLQLGFFSFLLSWRIGKQKMLVIT